MTAFVGIGADETLALDGYYRVVIEKATSFSLYTFFRNQVNTVYASMYARTGVLVPVVPNPVLQGTDDDAYVIDIGLINSGDAATVTAREAVRRIEAITGGSGFSSLLQREYAVRSFTALNSVTDVRDGAPDRDAIQAQVENQKQLENPLNSVGHWLTLVVVAIVALALIQVSKDL